VLVSLVLSKGMTKKKKPLTPSLEQEAQAFVKGKKDTPVAVPEQLSPPREQLAASVLAGLLAAGGNTRAEELVEEAYRYVDLLLQYKK
jgi:hypothetical protein